MSLARARILVIHSGPYLLATSYTALAAFAYLLSPLGSTLALVITVAILVAVVVSTSRLTARHLLTSCPRCDELRPVVSARIEGIDDPHKRLKAYRRSHFARWVGIGVVALSVLTFIAAGAWLDGPDFRAGLAVGWVIFIVGLWCLLILLARHIQYHTHRCPWCQQLIQRRIARDVMRDVARKLDREQDEAE